MTILKFTLAVALAADPDAACIRESAAADNGNSSSDAAALMKACLFMNLFKLQIAADCECTLMIIARALAIIWGYPCRTYENKVSK